MARLCVAVAGCCVKREEEYQGLLPRHPSPPSDSDSPGVWRNRSIGQDTGPCIVCREAPADTACQPCGHVLACFGCSQRYVAADGSAIHPDARCPCCRRPVRGFQRIRTRPPDFGWNRP
mmetsp:Transcript_102614/g.203712  ORF Transcript_102614/g.203712 Transcript_102614/m.203712 type:complete len:119 (-) Transcript_102614:72-428(-)